MADERLGLKANLAERSRATLLQMAKDAPWLVIAGAETAVLGAMAGVGLNEGALAVGMAVFAVTNSVGPEIVGARLGRPDNEEEYNFLTPIRRNLIPGIMMWTVLAMSNDPTMSSVFHKFMLSINSWEMAHLNKMVTSGIDWVSNLGQSIKEAPTNVQSLFEEGPQISPLDATNDVLSSSTTEGPESSVGTSGSVLELWPYIGGIIAVTGLTSYVMFGRSQQEE